MTLTINDIKCCLDVCEAMIDRLQRELYSNSSMMGAVNSAYESLSENEKNIYKAKREQLNNLLKYKTSVLDYALTILSGGSGTEPSGVTIATYTDSQGNIQNFNFSI